MPDLIIKPTAGSGNKLILQDQGGGALITSDDSGFIIGSEVTVPAAGITGVLPVGVTGGSGLDAVPAAAITGSISNPSTFTTDLTVADSTGMMLVGPVTIPNGTVNGKLIVHDELDITGDLEVSTSGSISII